MLLIQFISNDDPPRPYWLTRPDWTSPSSKSGVLAEPEPTLNGEQLVQQNKGLRADTALTIARNNLSNTLSFWVREGFPSAAQAGSAAATRWTEDLPREGTLLLCFGAPGDTPAQVLFEQVAVKSFARTLGGRSVLFGYTLVGGRMYNPDAPVDLIGQRRSTMTFSFAGQLSASQMGGLWTPDLVTSVIALDLFIGDVADADIVGRFLDDNSNDLGISFTLPAGHKMAHISLDPQVQVPAATSLVPVLSAAGSNAAPGQNLQITLTARQ